MSLCMVSIQERFVTVLWEGHKIFKNIPLLFDISNIKSKIWRFIQIVAAYSGFYMNFNDFSWKCRCMKLRMLIQKCLHPIMT